MAGGDDRLSELSDDLLRRVLHFAPLKEAASTTALSRRWRTPLWLSSGAVNLEARLEDYERDNRYGSKRDEAEAKFFSRRDAFVSAATAALEAADVPVTRLTLRLDSDGDQPAEYFLNRYRDKNYVRWCERNVVDVVLSHPAARHVRELRLVPKQWRSDDYYDGEVLWNKVGFYFVNLDSLPSETLHVLEMTNCQGLYHEERAVLPLLSSLRLYHCSEDLGSLQRVMDAAPGLTTVSLESVIIDATEKSPPPSRYAWGYNDDEENAPRTPPKEATPRRLRCPAASVLVLERCKWEEKKQERNPYGDYDNDEKPVTRIGVEINAPRLRRFRYKGLFRPFSFSPPPPELEQVVLHFFPDTNWRNNDPNRDLNFFWRFVRSFTNTKEMRLRLNHLEDIAILSEAKRVQLLPVFHRLEQLELQGAHRPKGKTAAVAIANLLRCCPVLRDLRIDLTAEQHDASKRSKYIEEFFERKFRLDRNKSVHGLDRCGDSELTMVALEGDDDGANYDELSDIPGLSRWSSTECLKSSLRTVGLKFRLEKFDCLGVRLIKFFANHAMVLIEMHIDAGNEKYHKHMNSKIEKWIFNSSTRRQSGATSFVVLPLNRRLYQE
ncbi:unnamed protein product [Alopecurus aequalis]